MDEKTFELFQKDYELLVTKYADQLSIVELLGCLDIARLVLEKNLLQQTPQITEPTSEESKGSAKVDKIKNAMH